MNLALQNAVVALLVLACAGYAFARLAPGAQRKLRRFTALWLMAPGHAAPLRRFGLRLMPAPPPSANGCAAGCSDCDNCGPSSAPLEQPLVDLRTRRD